MIAAEKGDCETIKAGLVGKQCDGSRGYMFELKKCSMAVLDQEQFLEDGQVS
jgi:hypothetical protein